MFVRDIQDMAQKAAPFLSWDSDPYAVLVDGHIDWVLDGYTTTGQLPVLAERKLGAGAPGQRSARRATTTCATR